MIVLNAKTDYSRCVFLEVHIHPTEEEKSEKDRLKSLILELKRKKGLPKEGEEENHDDQQEVELDKPPKMDLVTAWYN